MYLARISEDLQSAKLQNKLCHIIASGQTAYQRAICIPHEKLADVVRKLPISMPNISSQSS